MYPTQPAPRKRRSSAQGLKALITAASIAATLGGWVALSAGGAGAASAAGPAGIQAPSPGVQPGFFPADQAPGFSDQTGSSGLQSPPSFGFPAPRARTRSSR
ncbi:MAG TPA: hypothetical protein VKY74_05995 [Chloroflexia bacterium]|nr:hypothetical protein [Chloroflexia bacterium]